MYFDGAVTVSGNGVGAVLISPKGAHCLVAIQSQIPCTNNKKEYDTCIMDLQVALEMNIQELEVHGDSILIICQTTRELDRKSELIKMKNILVISLDHSNYIVQPYTENQKPVCRCSANHCFYA